MNRLVLWAGVWVAVMPSLAFGINVYQSNDGFDRCARAPLEGVHDEDRLRLLAPCRYAEGTIMTRETDAPPVKGDGDIRYILIPDPPYLPLIEHSRCANRPDCLYLETVPIFQRFPRSLRVQDPAPGDHVAVSGAWVYDTAHGWNEIHSVAWMVVQ